MRQIILGLVAAAALATAPSVQADNPKREFRGAWMHTIGQKQYHEKSTDELKAYLRDQLDKLHEAGCNAVLFQVRPQADALYPSALEPWSRFLTDNGAAPDPYWDPLQFMIDECHARGMELHAWLNPYRVTSGKGQVLPEGHIYHKHPERFIAYADNKLYFDPGLPENRAFIGDVVSDIVSRYDIDGIHFDDYFYPYPVSGAEFGDDASYAKYGKGMDRGDWRRHNVDMLISELNTTIKAIKPWVRFGISPFCVWRNKSSDPRGSETSALQNYDGLYADVLLWAKKGWIDYQLPQLYLELEHKRAPYTVLVDWWNRNAEGRHMYIGQDVGRTMKMPDIAPSTNPTQLHHKMTLARNGENIQGNCWWPGYAITRNVGGIADSLKADYQSTPALVPNYPWISTKHPAAVNSLFVNGKQLTWHPAPIAGKTTDPVRFVVYRFDAEPTKADYESAANIVGIIPGNAFTATKPGWYAVTALDRVNNESDPVVVKVD